MKYQRNFQKKPVLPNHLLGGVSVDDDDTKSVDSDVTVENIYADHRQEVIEDSLDSDNGGRIAIHSRFRSTKYALSGETFPPETEN